MLDVIGRKGVRRGQGGGWAARGGGGGLLVCVLSVFIVIKIAISPNNCSDFT